MSVYIAKPGTWYDAGTEAKVICFYDPLTKSGGLFSGVSDGQEDEEGCGTEEFFILDDEAATKINNIRLLVESAQNEFWRLNPLVYQSMIQFIEKQIDGVQKGDVNESDYIRENIGKHHIEDK